MGIRTLHRHHAPAQAGTDAEPAPRPPAVPPHAADASTARVPADLRASLRRPRRAEVEARVRLWADQARGYLALLLTVLQRPRPTRTVTVFTATLAPVTGPNRSVPDRPRPDRRTPEPGATP